MIEFVFDSHGKERTFECTPEHLLPVKRNGEMSIVMAKDISMDDELYISDEFFDPGP
jgi:intein/homing endonuclease